MIASPENYAEDGSQMEFNTVMIKSYLGDD